jgi:hypothetical protein
MNTRTLLESTDLVSVLACYDTPSAGRHVKELLDRLIAHYGAAVTFDVRLWRFDLLEEAEPYRQARADAQAAALFVVAYAGNRQAGPGFLQLVEAWSAGRGDSEVALVALKAGDEENGGLVRVLCDAAGRIGVTFFFSGDGDLSTQELAGLSRLDERQARRHSGLNDRALPVEPLGAEITASSSR